jgi:hypothetical protein
MGERAFRVAQTPSRTCTDALHLVSYATGEFEVTEERLGGKYLFVLLFSALHEIISLFPSWPVYQTHEHLDNPKDYNDNKDARVVHPKLRGPVTPQELDIDPRTGMLVSNAPFI